MPTTTNLLISMIKLQLKLAHKGYLRNSGHARSGIFCKRVKIEPVDTTSNPIQRHLELPVSMTWNVLSRGGNAYASGADSKRAQGRHGRELKNAKHVMMCFCVFTIKSDIRATIYSVVGVTVLSFTLRR
jgi:hypothetical protein